MGLLLTGNSPVILFRIQSNGFRNVHSPEKH